MKKLMFLALFIYHSALLISQSNWIWQNPSARAERINAVKFITREICFSCGSYGILQKSIDGGYTWNNLINDERINFKNIIVDADNFVLAVSDSGTIYKTTDLGNTWKIIKTGLYDLYNIDFVNMQTGFSSSSNKIYKTTNGGENWVLFYTSGYDRNNLSFLDESSGYIASYNSYGGNDGLIYKTTNGGLNWTTTSTPGMRRVLFVDNNTGYLSGTYSNGKIWKTTNSGINWFSVYENSSHILDLKFLTRDTGFALSTYQLLKTVNGGNTWTPVGFSNLRGDKYSFDVYDVNTIMCGITQGGVGITTNGGANWNINLKGTLTGLEAIQFINDYTGYAAGTGNTILKTTNAGINWYAQTSSADTIHPYSFYALYFLNENTGYVTGDMGIIKKTTNQGLNWITQVPGGATNHMYDVKFVNENTGFTVGRYGLYRHTTNGGINWIIENIGATYHLNTICFANENTGFIGGSDKYLYKTTNAGVNWEQITNPVSGEITRIYFVDSKTGYIAVDSNYSTSMILKTTDSGISWQMKSLKDMNYVTGLKFFNNSTGYAYSLTYRTLSFTTDGGETWRKQKLYTDKQYWNMYFTSLKTGYLAGSDGAIIKTTNGGGFFPDDPPVVLPVNYYLHQNYPNPFNPVTNIKFEIPVSGNISIKLYNITGKEIAIITNNFYQAGKWEVTFNGLNLSSGLYFYKLVTVGYTESKRMVLLK